MCCRSYLGGKRFPLLLVRAVGQWWLVLRHSSEGCLPFLCPPCQRNAGVLPHPNQPLMPGPNPAALSVFLGLQVRNHFHQTLGLQQDFYLCSTYWREGNMSQNLLRTCSPHDSLPLQWGQDTRWG